METISLVTGLLIGFIGVVFVAVFFTFIGIISVLFLDMLNVIKLRTGGTEPKITEIIGKSLILAILGALIYFGFIGIFQIISSF